MSENLEALDRRRNSAAQLNTVVRTMKTLAASSIAKYEMAVTSLQDYYRTISLSICAVMAQPPIDEPAIDAAVQTSRAASRVVLILFGSDQGLVGRFNNILADLALDDMKDEQGDKEAWIIGGQLKAVWQDEYIPVTNEFPVPNDIEESSGLVDQILTKIEKLTAANPRVEIYVYHHSPQTLSAYGPERLKLFPLDKDWKKYLPVSSWPTRQLPQIIGGVASLLPELSMEFLFMSVYKAAVGSLASENASRLAAMQRAQKNIEEMQQDLEHSYNRLRQESIDEELFDVIAGFEAIKK